MLNMGNIASKIATLQGSRLQRFATPLPTFRGRRSAESSSDLNHRSPGYRGPSAVVSRGKHGRQGDFPTALQGFIVF